MHLKMDYIEFSCGEFAASKRFFEQAFAWECEDYGPDYQALHQAGIDAGMARGETLAPLIVLKSDDLDAAVAVASCDYILPVEDDAVLCERAVERLAAEVMEESERRVSLVMSTSGTLYLVATAFIAAISMRMDSSSEMLGTRLICGVSAPSFMVGMKDLPRNGNRPSDPISKATATASVRRLRAVAPSSKRR